MEEDVHVDGYAIREWTTFSLDAYGWGDRLRGDANDGECESVALLRETLRPVRSMRVPRA